MKLTAFTRLVLVLAVTAWVFLLPIPAVAMILALELVILLYIKRDRATMAAIGTLTVFTALMIIFQMLFGSSLEGPDGRPADVCYDNGLPLPFGIDEDPGYFPGSCRKVPYAL